MKTKYYKRFLKKVKKGSVKECWLWTASRGGSGYGKMSVDGRLVGAHRLAFEQWKGPIPEGLQVMHSCDNRACVNPKHLFLGTQKDNMEDCISKGRLRPGAGERHARARFTKQQVTEIRERAQRETRASLAREFGVSNQAVDKIVNRVTWKDV